MLSVRLQAKLAAVALFTLVLAMVLGLAPTTVRAQTTATGAVVSDTRWSTAGSPYVVSGQLVVQGGATLSIDPGVLIYMAPGARLTVQAGSVQALGLPANPIRVLSDKTRQGQAPAPGDWDQWVFTGGTVNTRLEQMLFEHGRGLAINGSAPVLNGVDIRNQLGAAIAIDLAASPTGVGNRASGNTLNGIAVPAGDVSGTVRWGLRGIPYLVSAGTVSVGASPAIGSIAPAIVEQGQTVTLTVNGTRLEGVARASFDQSGLTLTPFSTGSSTQAFLQLKVDAAAPLGATNLRLQVDAGEIVFANAITVTPLTPAITSLSPSSVLLGAGATDITVSGRNFTTSSEVLFNSASVPTTYSSATQLRATLPSQTTVALLQAQVRTPDASRPGQYLISSAISLDVQAPVPPTMAIEPTPIALPPDSKPRDITLRLSKADYRDHTVSLSISDPSKATVSPATLVIAAGQTTARITVVPKVTGTVSLIADSITLQRVAVPLFITADFRGANTAYAAPVGVVLPTSAVPETRPVTVVNANVGVSVGGVLTSISPNGWAIGSNPTVVVRGADIPSGAQVSVVPSVGINIGTAALKADGTEISVQMSTASDAAIGPRRIVVRDTAGKEIVFANPAQSAVQLMTGTPTIDSIEPIFGTRGTVLKLIVRGHHLQQGAVQFLPATGVRVDAAPIVSDDGTLLTAYLDIAADAQTGSRVVQVRTPSGATDTAPLSQNTFSIVSTVRDAVTPIVSQAVGVIVGSAAAAPQAVQIQPGSSVVGVLLGAGVTEVAPNIGVVGSNVLVTVRGAGLQGVTAVGLTPSAGITVGATSVNAEGTELQIDVAVDAGASLGARRLTLTATDRPVTFIRPGDGSFLVSAPVPELASVQPSVLVAGQAGVAMTVRGRNFTNVSAVRVEPGQGITVSGPFVTNADGTLLSFTASVAAGASSGERAVVITSAAGDSNTSVQSGNLVRIANQIGSTYADLSSAPVGVLVGSAAPTPQQVDGSLVSASVGVMVGTASVPDTVSSTAASGLVGVVIGGAAQAMSPSGWLQGASGDIVVSGQGLDSVASVSVVPSAGLLIGTPVASSGGTRLTISISVAPDAQQVVRELRLANVTGGQVSFVDAAVAEFGIGSLPTITSVSPIFFEQGKSVTLVVRGSNLKGVSRVTFAPVAGLRVFAEFAWSQDGLGELLTVPVFVDANAAPGSRVIQLDVPGGSTSVASTPANTVTVVAPQ